MWDPQYSLLVHQKEEFKQKLDNTNHRSMKIHDFSCNSPVKRDIITQSYFWTGNMVELVREKIKKNSRIIHKDVTVVTRYCSPKCCRMSRKSIWRVPKLLWEEFCRITVQQSFWRKQKAKHRTNPLYSPYPVTSPQWIDLTEHIFK